MRTDDFFEALGELDDSLIINARNTPDNPVKIKVERRSWKPFAAAAACVVALVAVAALNFGKIADFVKNAKTNDGYPEDAIYQYTGDFTELEPCYYPMIDYFYIDDNFYKLANASKLIVTGTFVDNARQTEPVNGEVKCDLVTYSEFGMSYNKFRVDEVFKGDVSVGDELIIGDKYFVNGSDLNYYPGNAFTPMIKGDRWVYFLRVDDNGYYDALGLGRYPIPGEEHPFVLAPRWHGAYDHYDFSDKIYEDVKIMLGYIDGVQKLDPGDNRGNYEFTMPEFLGETFVWRDKDVYVLNGGSETARTLYSAWGISSLYLADLNGDGKREMVFGRCVTSGIWSCCITVYDHANSKLYILRRDTSDEELGILDDCLEVRDGVLYAVRYDHGWNNELSAVPLKFEDLEEVTTTVPETIEYNGKTYLITDKTIRDGEVSVSIGLTQLEYQIGDFVEVLAMVHNYTDKPIKLQMPVLGENSHTEINVTLTQGDTGLYEFFGDGVFRGFDDAIGYHTIEPGDTYYQEMLFSPYKQRYDPENTIVPLYKPLGAYDGLAVIKWFFADDDLNGEPTHDQVKFNVNIVDRIGINSKEFTLDEFPDAEFTYSYGSLRAVENEIKYSMFGGNSMDSLYLADLNGDGKREFCGSVKYDSETGITDERIFVYDFANKKLYELCDIGSYDYHIESGNIGGEWYLRAVTCEYITGSELCSEPLTLDILNEVKKATQVSKPVLDSVLKVAYRPADFDRTYKFRMPEFRGEYFVCDKDSVRIEDRFFDTVLIHGEIDELYLADLNGDFKRELVAVLNGGHYVTDGETERVYGSIMVYDYANDKQYERVNYEGFTLIEKDNKLFLHNDLNSSDELFAPDADKYAPVDCKVQISKIEY